MPGLTSPLANEMLIRAQSYALFISLHNSDPSNTGTGELTAGANYQRRAALWAAPASGKLALTGAVHMSVNAASSIGFYGLWNQQSQGVFCGGASLSAVEVFAAAGTYTVSSLNFSIPVI